MSGFFRPVPQETFSYNYKQLAHSLVYFIQGLQTLCTVGAVRPLHGGMFVLSTHITTMKTAQSFSPELYVVPGLQSTGTADDNLVDTAWLFAYTMLWNHQTFSGSEIREAKYYIKELLLTAKNHRKAFLNFCQRIILARQNVQLLNTDYLALPSLWFDAENMEGFAATREWLQAVKSIRYSLPTYQIELRALAEAVLEFSEEPSPKNFAYWRGYFIEHEKPILLHLFGVYCSNQQFNIR
jgi:hypothetical protein